MSENQQMTTETDGTQEYWACKSCADVLLIDSSQPDECPVCKAPAEHLFQYRRVFK